MSFVRMIHSTVGMALVVLAVVVALIALRDLVGVLAREPGLGGQPERQHVVEVFFPRPQRSRRQNRERNADEKRPIRPALIMALLRQERILTG